MRELYRWRWPASVFVAILLIWLVIPSKGDRIAEDDKQNGGNRHIANNEESQEVSGRGLHNEPLNSAVSASHEKASGDSAATDNQKKDEKADSPNGEEGDDIADDPFGAEDENLLALKADDKVDEPPADTDLSEEAEEQPDMPTLEMIEAAEKAKAVSLEKSVNGEFMKNESLSDALGRFNVGVQTAIDIAAAFKGVFDIRQIRTGNKFEIKTDPTGKLVSFTLNYSELMSYYVRREGDKLIGYKVEGETEMFVEQVSGVIESSLSDSLWRLGEKDTLTSLIADVFAWDIDFYSDCRKGDTWKIMVEKHYFHGRFMRYGQVLAASYHGSIVGDRYVYYFQSEDDKVQDFFDEKGNSIRRSFMRAPLDTTRVTSKFGFRIHPTLHKYKKHEGIDYGAASGTPVWAVADGKVLGAGWMGACGKGVKLSHYGEYVTVYCHLSSVYVKSGQFVKQKRMIGRVGTTGRSTGPHLHFGITYKGRWINPQSMKMTPGKPLDPRYLGRYKEARELLKGKLDAIEVPVFYGPELPDNYVDTSGSRLNSISAADKARAAKEKARSPWRNNPPHGYQPRPPGIKAVKE